MGMGTYEYAAEFRDVVTKIIETEIDRLRPLSRVAEVQAINKDNLTAEVKLAGDEGGFAARFGLSLMPRKAGNLVRVNGGPGNYYITEILNDTGEHADYEEPITTIIPELIDKTTWVFRQPEPPTLDQVGARGFLIGDVWFDTDDDNYMRRWDGTQWANIDALLAADLEAALEEQQTWVNQRLTEETAGIGADIAAAEQAAKQYALEQITTESSAIALDIAAAQGAAQLYAKTYADTQITGALTGLDTSIDAAEAAAKAYSDQKLAAEADAIAADIAAVYESAAALSALNDNSTFSDWTGTFPVGTFAWTNPAPTKEAGIVRTPPNALRFTATGTALQGITLGSMLAPLPLSDYVTVEADVYLVSGNFSGAGVLLDWLGFSGSPRDSLLFNTAGSAPATGKWYRFTKVLRRPVSTTGTHTGYTGYLMANYPSLLGTASIKTFIVDRLAFRPSTQEEITAYNAPGDAQAKADAAVSFLQSRGTDLVINGAATLNDNTNFSQFTLDKSDMPTGANGSFDAPVGVALVRTTDEFVPVDPNKEFLLRFQAKQKGSTVGGYMYSGLQPFDAFENVISPVNYMYIPGTLTTLAAPLNPGDTTITLTSSANWYGSAARPAGSATHQRSIIWWDYVDPGGKAWPENTYSRSVFAYDKWADGGIVGNVITLRAPYDGPAKPAGTKLSNATSGGSYMYGGAVNSVVPKEWTTYQASVRGTVSQTEPSSGNSASFAGGWPPGVAKAKLLWLVNRQGSGASDANSEHSIALVSFSDAQAAQYLADAQKALTDSWRVPGQVTINGGMLGADTVSADAVAANAIGAKHTITGPIIQTAAAASRGIKMVSSANGGYGSLIGYDAVGGTSFTINGQTGAATFKGEITSGSFIKGAILQGPLETTSAAARGVKVTDTGIYGYDSVVGSPTLGQATFALDAATGAVTFRGAITSGSVITGATVNAALFQTTEAGSRGIKIVSSANGGYGSLISYAGDGSPTFTLNGQTGAVTLTGTLTAALGIVGASITGGVLQTTALANRGIKVVAADNGGYGQIVGYDSGGTPTFSINGQTGAALFKGEIESGSFIKGATLLGTVQTTAAGSRGVKISNSGIYAYDSVVGSPTIGDVTFGVDSATGAVTLKGAVVTSGDINGSTITGGLIRTASSGKRITIDAFAGVLNMIRFHTGASGFSDSSPGYIIGDGAAGQSYIGLQAPSFTSQSSTYLPRLNLINTNNANSTIELAGAKTKVRGDLDIGLADPPALKITAQGDLQPQDNTIYFRTSAGVQFGYISSNGTDLPGVVSVDGLSSSGNLTAPTATFSGNVNFQSTTFFTGTAQFNGALNQSGTLKTNGITKYTAGGILDIGTGDAVRVASGAQGRLYIGDGGRAMRSMNFGQTSGRTTNASGQYTVPHGLGSAPDLVVATPMVAGTNSTVQVSAFNSTNFTVTLRDAASGATLPNGTSKDVSWIAISIA